MLSWHQYWSVSRLTPWLETVDHISRKESQSWLQQNCYILYHHGCYCRRCCHWSFDNDFFKENSLVAMTFTMSASMGNSNQTLRSINWLKAICCSMFGWNPRVEQSWNTNKNFYSVWRTNSFLSELVVKHFLMFCHQFVSNKL